MSVKNKLKIDQHLVKIGLWTKIWDLLFGRAQAVYCPSHPK